MESQKCSIHKKILEYYCTEDDTCVCLSCMIGGHKGHEMESLDEASEKKKETLRIVLQKLLTKREETEERRLVTLPCLKISGDVWKTWGDLCDTEDEDNEDRERQEKLLHDGGSLDVVEISHTLHAGLSYIITEGNVDFYIQEAADILLDVNTAHNNLHISDDRKTVSWSDIDQNRTETPERFQFCPQVLSSQSFSSGRHYWEVDVGGSDVWIVGMCYPSIDRRGWQSGIGWNNKSWGLYRYINQYEVRHDNKQIPLPTNLSSNRVRIYLDYEAGRISFYDLCDPIRHLYTFTTTFTEPLHAGNWVVRGCIKIFGGNREI
ncbi:E3 ubiquitin-protein ligase TRIM39-like [Rana temporaria]|uniref:E3 ubiquitin-protein ligase TRIM39-like n=1 Tax=Rana temporaria TaxID=8407 RepID=UPI001AAD859E|nr:E3 ubiquitin-protein ligase TRIM39-like [Rana temporaria]